MQTSNPGGSNISNFKTCNLKLPLEKGGTYRRNIFRIGFQSQEIRVIIKKRGMALETNTSTKQKWANHLVRFGFED